MTIHLYHCVSARSFRPLWMLEELQLPYQLHMLPFPPRALARSFLEQNPLGTVPLLVQGQGAEEVRMTESAAICQYLAATHPDAGLDVPPTHPAYGAYLNWLHMSDATLTFPQTLLLRYGRFEPAERQQPQVVEDYRRWFLARLRAVEARAAQAEHLCAGRFTAADVARGKPAPDLFLHAAERMGVDPAKCVVVEDSKYGVQAAVAAEKRIPGSFLDLDAVFGDLGRDPRLRSAFIEARAALLTRGVRATLAALG